MALAKKLWSLLTRRERVRAGLLILAVLVGSVLESMAVGLIFPIAILINNPAAITENDWARAIFGYVGIVGAREMLIMSCLVVLAFYLFKNVLLTGSTYLQYRFINHTESALSCRLLSAYLHAPWTFHLQRNTAELLRNISFECTFVFYNVVSPSITLLNELLVAGAILLLLLMLDPVSSLIAIVLLGGSSALFYRAIQNRIDRLGVEQQQKRGDMIKWVNQGLGGVKEIKVLGCEAYFSRAFATNSRGFAEANTYLCTVSQLPRFFFETIIVTGLLLVLMVTFARGEASAFLLPKLMLIGAAAYRLMPSLSRSISAVTNIRCHLPAVDAVYTDVKLLETEGTTGQTGRGTESRKPPIEHGIELREVSYRYLNASENAISEVSLYIPKGSSVAFTGPSGAGKTTTVDVILGLLKPCSGQVLVDGRDIHTDLRGWQRVIGYIPQRIFLSDDTVRRNVAFGLADAEIDEERVWKALREAQLEEFVRSLPDQLDTYVGEDGGRLSGGQRQRIGIARALYHDPEVLVLDEATSSLDMGTEKEITNTIDRLSGAKTIIVIAHRPSTIEKCTLRYEVNGGRIEPRVLSAGAVDV